MTTFWLIGGLVALFLVLWFAVAESSGDGQHPTARADLDHASHIVPASRYEGYPRVATTYAMVAAIPGVIDGLYCYCECAEHSGHYSLLDCFASRRHLIGDGRFGETDVAARSVVAGEAVQQ
ncbi:MAG: PCYCGC motif-containing (lipo)protein [Longimicrobiales bacterium]